MMEKIKIIQLFLLQDLLKLRKMLALYLYNILYIKIPNVLHYIKTSIEDRVYIKEKICFFKV